MEKKKKKMRFIHWHKRTRDFFLTTFIASLFCMLLSLVIAGVEEKSSNYNPLHVFFRDFDFTDFYYLLDGSNLSKTKVNDIVVVKMGQGKRAKLADLINQIQKSNAQNGIICLDFSFTRPAITHGDSVGSDSLQNTIDRANNLVIGYRFPDDGAPLDLKGSLVPRSNILKGRNRVGFVNIGDSTSRIRTVPLTLSRGGDTALSLDYAAYLKLNPGAPIGDRPDPLRIRYLPASSFNTLSDDSILDFPETQEERLKAATVVYISQFSVSKNDGMPVDAHFTPLNKNLAGTSWPDMDGVYIHANVMNNLVKTRQFVELTSVKVALFSIIPYFFFMALMITFFCKARTVFDFTMVLIYEPLIYGVQILIANYFYARNIYINFDFFFLVMATTPLCIAMAQFIEFYFVDRGLLYLSKGKYRTNSCLIEELTHIKK